MTLEIDDFFHPQLTLLFIMMLIQANIPVNYITQRLAVLFLNLADKIR